MEYKNSPESYPPAPHVARSLLHASSGFFVGLTLCSEYRLGRVGALSWTCHATGILVLLMAATYQIRVLFVCLSVLALMSIGEHGYRE